MDEIMALIAEGRRRSVETWKETRSSIELYLASIQTEQPEENIDIAPAAAVTKLKNLEPARKKAFERIAWAKVHGRISTKEEKTLRLIVMKLSTARAINQFRVENNVSN